jgi:outer membrane receptor protein involved in Fe transport
MEALSKKNSEQGRWTMKAIPQAVLGLGLAVFANVADAQEVSPTSSDASVKKISLEEVVVTGTHIRGAGPVGSHLIVIDRDEIEKSGHGRLQEFFETVTQNFDGSASEDTVGFPSFANSTRGQAIDLRGLGSSSTLILINGRRQPTGGVQGAFVDISSIATSAVERIEILTDGASALYGSDAIGGVVNFVLRKDYEGQETGAYFATADGAAKELRISQLIGRSWTGGNALFGYQYSKRDALMNADTPYGSLNRDFRKLGGTDWRSGAGIPGFIYNPNTFEPGFSMPAGQDGTNLTVDDLIPGQINFQNNVTGIAHLPEQTTHSAFFRISHDLSDRFEVFAEGRYGKREMVFPFSEPVYVFFVPSTNPFYVNPFEADLPDLVVVEHNFRNELGLNVQKSNTETYSFATGFVAKLGQQWELNVNTAYGREKNAWKYNTINDGSRSDNCLSGSSNSGCPGAPLNVFGDASNNDPATLAYLRLDELRQGVSTVGSTSAVFDGPIFQLPAGLARLAIGADYRDERLRAEVGTLSPSDGLRRRSLASIGDMDRQVSAIFGEAILPVLGNLTDTSAAHSLELSLATRYEEYSDFGSTLNPKIGINFVPTAGVRLRATWGASFRAPLFNEISPSTNPSSAGASFGVPDPKSPTGSSNIIFLNGFNPDLREETANIWNVGFDFTPSWLPGFSTSATYFSLDYEDKIGEGGSGENTLLIEDQWSEIITRNPTSAQIATICAREDYVGVCPIAVAAIVDTRLRNLAVLRVRGVDFDLGYQRGMSLGSINLGLAGTYNLNYDRAVSSTAPSVDVLNTATAPLDLRLRGRAGWGLNQLQINAFVNYSNNYRIFTNGPKVGSWTTVDFSIGYQFVERNWVRGTRVQLSATNLFDREPPFVNLTSGYIATHADQRGRSISMNVIKEWGRQ